MARKGIVAGAIILTLAGVITRILGFVYRIFMSNVIGAEGMGLYQLIMPIYSLAWSITCSGFTTTVSKLTAQERSKGEYGNIRRTLKQSVVITSCTGICVCLILFFGAGFVAEFFFKDQRVTLPLRILALAIPFMSAGSCLRGYFFGMQETLVPAINQVLEQVTRMTVIFFLAGAMMPLGLTYACAAAVIGIVAEEIFSFLFIVSAYKKYKIPDVRSKLPSLSNTKVLSVILAMALPLTANRVTGSLLATVENALIPRQLQHFGMSAAEAISTYGRITGMAMPLILFPSAFLVSLSISLVPAVSEASASRNFSRITYTASKSMLFASVIGFCAAALFISFPEQLGYVIYKQDIGEMLLLLGVMCPFLYMQLVLSGILNGLGYQVFIFRNSLISSVINIGFIYFLIPRFGINAFILGWFVSLIVVCRLELEKLREKADLILEFSNWFIKPLLSALAAGLTVRYVANKFLFDNLGIKFGLMAAIPALGILYLIFILLSGCLQIDDLSNIFKSVKPAGPSAASKRYKNDTKTQTPCIL